MALRGLVVALGLAAGMAAFTPEAKATGGQDQTVGVVEVCVNRANGSIRIVGSPRDCRPSETFQRWNVRGPAGEPGAPGAPGTPGADGAAGRDGRDGRDGKDAVCDDAGPLPARSVIGRALFERSNDPSFETEVLAFAGEVTNTVTDSSGGGATGKLSFGDFTLNKLVDAASPHLLMLAATGRHLDKVTVQIFRAGTSIPELTYTLKIVFITQIKSTAVAAAPGEDVKLNVGELDVLFEPDGGAPVQYCWSRIHNAPCAP
jgi:type VI protein secretion system component Hcp